MKRITVEFLVRYGWTPEHAAAFLAEPNIYDPDNNVPFSNFPQGEGSGECAPTRWLPSAMELQERAGVRAWDAYSAVFAGGGY